MRIPDKSLATLKSAGRGFAALALAAAFVAGPAAGAASASPKGCPPGLAKQGRCGHDAPGHSDKRQWDDHDHDGDRRHRWTRGEHAPRDRYVVIERWRDRGLPPPPSGHVYVRVDGEVLLIAAATSVIVDILSN